MDQTKIWDHFQSKDADNDVFLEALPRYRFIAKRVRAGASVLNVGVGNGGLEGILLSKGASVSCLDPSAAAVDRIREKLQLGERAQAGFAQAMPFADSQFDFVVMSEVLEHLTDEVLNASLVEVRRVLKPGGHLIGTVPALENLSLGRTVCPHCGGVFHRWGHERSFSPADLSGLFVRHGFAVRRNEIRTFPDWRLRGLKNLAINLARYWLARSGSHIGTSNIYFEAVRGAKQ